MRAIMVLALLPSVAFASTLTPLADVGPTSGAYRWYCEATGFNVDGTISGACQEKHYGTCSGRGCHPVVITLGTWVVTWDRSGNPTLSSDPTSWPGVQGSGTVVEVNGTPYYYITSDAAGDELVTTNACQPYLVTP